MTRRVVGYFLPQDAVRQDKPKAPHVNVQVGDDDETLRIPFLIDTGADRTLLSPYDAWALLGDQYFQLNFATSKSREDFTGVGAGVARGMLHFSSLTFFAEDGSEITRNLPIAVAEPVPPYPGKHGNWLMPSLLGRDVLQHFDLRLSYHPQSVVLEEASAGG